MPQKWKTKLKIIENVEQDAIAFSGAMEYLSYLHRRLVRAAKFHEDESEIKSLGF